MTSFANATGGAARRDNWQQILALARRKGLPLSQGLADGTMRVRDGGRLGPPTIEAFGGPAPVPLGAAHWGPAALP